MTTKTIKTILFAALFAAMILPFSGMQSVAAEPEYRGIPDLDELPDLPDIELPGEPVPVGESSEVPVAVGEPINEPVADNGANLPDDAELKESDKVPIADGIPTNIPEPTNGANTPDGDVPVGVPAEPVPNGIPTNTPESDNGANLPEGTIPDGTYAEELIEIDPEIENVDNVHDNDTEHVADETHLPTDAELGESEITPVPRTGYHMPDDAEYGESDEELPEVTPQVGEIDGTHTPEGEEVEVDPSRSRATPTPEAGANLPEDAELDVPEVPVDQSDPEA